MWTIIVWIYEMQTAMWMHTNNATFMWQMNWMMVCPTEVTFTSKCTKAIWMIWRQEVQQQQQQRQQRKRRPRRWHQLRRRRQLNKTTTNHAHWIVDRKVFAIDAINNSSSVCVHSAKLASNAKTVSSIRVYSRMQTAEANIPFYTLQFTIFRGAVPLSSLSFISTQEMSCGNIRQRWYDIGLATNSLTNPLKLHRQKKKKRCGTERNRYDRVLTNATSCCRTTISIRLCLAFADINRNACFCCSFGDDKKIIMDQIQPKYPKSTKSVCKQFSFCSLWVSLLTVHCWLSHIAYRREYTKHFQCIFFATFFATFFA